MSDLSCPRVGYMYVRKWSQSCVVGALEQKFGQKNGLFTILASQSVLSGERPHTGSESDVSVLGA